MPKPLPVVKVKLCSHLKNVKPGQLGPDLLKNIEKGKLHHCAADAYEAMDEAANAQGIDLSPTSTADTYRSLEMQEYGFFQRYTTTPNKRMAKQKPRIYKGKAWYLKPKMAPLAVPGTSNHNLGIAVDIANASGKRLEWMLANAHKYGFSWEVQSEPWHLRYVAGDDIPEAVRTWKDSKSGHNPEQKPACPACGRDF
jgi:LAS superfamily LD-carboxypeptidase LdcB